MSRTPPASVGILERWVYDHAKRVDIPATRLRNTISYMVLGGVLDRQTDARGRSHFLLKGAVTLELRFQGKSRATEDLDVSVVPPGDIVAQFDTALRDPYGDFTFVREDRVHVMPNGVRRVRVKVRYKTKPWATVQVDLGPVDHADIEAERVPAFDLSVYGLTGPRDLTCLSLRYQIAQKIHAVTAVRPDGKPNDRFRDVIDLILMRELVLDLEAVRQACENVFRWRNTHAWPPMLQTHPSWTEGYLTLATELGVTPNTLEDATALVQEFIDTVARACSS